MPADYAQGGQDYGVRHLHADQSATLEALVAPVLAAAEATAVTRGAKLTPRELIELGCVYADHWRVLNPDALFAAGTLLRVHTAPRRYPTVANLRARIVSETSEFIVLDKPAGLPVHAMVDNVKENVLSYLEAELARPLYITHRLDIQTCGLLLIALSAESQTRLNKQLQAKKIRRTYLAFTGAPLETGTYVHYMDHSAYAPKKIHDTEAAGAKRLRCELTVLSCSQVSRKDLEERWLVEELTCEKIYCLEIELGTGRTQQIRAQLSHMNATIISDHLYLNRSYLRDRLTLSRAIGLRANSLSNI